MDTWGFRLEAAKAIANVVLTYGADGFRDRSDNTDTSTSTGFAPGPPIVDPISKTPNAIFRSLGGFLQSDFHLAPRLSLIAGIRVQDIKADTRATPGVTVPLVSHENSTIVGTLNSEYLVTDHFSLVATVGRGFRSPNIIERFFNGPTPEGSGYQVRTPDLKPETSLNVDVGFRIQDRHGSARGVRIPQRDLRCHRPRTNGRQHQHRRPHTGAQLQQREHRQASLPRNRGQRSSAVRSMASRPRPTSPFSDTKDVRDPSNPVASSYGLKVGGEARYDHPNGRFWLSYGARHNGSQKDIDASQSPVGSPLPGLHGHDRTSRSTSLPGGSQRSLRCTATLDNWANRLYSEASSSSTLFRPSARSERDARLPGGLLPNDVAARRNDGGSSIRTPWLHYPFRTSRSSPPARTRCSRW